MMNKLLDKPVGKRKPIICSRCGKKVGFVAVKMRFQIKLLALGFLIALVTQVIAEFLLKIVLGS